MRQAISEGLALIFQGIVRLHEAFPNKRAAFRVELTVISENIGPETSTHRNLVGGFTWRLGIAK